jgi:hypothetical protein
MDYAITENISWFYFRTAMHAVNISHSYLRTVLYAECIYNTSPTTSSSRVLSFHQPHTGNIKFTESSVPEQNKL